MAIQPSSDMSGLAYYIRHRIFDEFVKQRKNSGVEEKWHNNEDDFNAVFKSEWKLGEGEDWRSKTVIKKVKVKVYTAFALVIDMLLQAGKIPFTLIPSPLDEMNAEELTEEQQSELDDNISDMVSIISQQFADCHADRSLMKNVMSGAKYGETYSHRYIQTIKRMSYQEFDVSEGYETSNGDFVRWKQVEKEIASPARRYISVWNMFRDMEVEDLQDGIGLIERELVSPYDLRLKQEKPLWIHKAIERCISEAAEPGGNAGNLDTDDSPAYLRSIAHRHKTIELLKFWGRVPRSVAEKFEKELTGKKRGKYGDFALDMTGSEYENDGYEVEIMAYVADKEVVRYARTDGVRPYGRTQWEDALDSPYGTGVADNISTTVQVLNGMVRAFEDNKKLSANVMGVGNLDMMPNWDKKFVPGEIVEVAEGVTAQEAFQPIVIPDVGETLLSGIGLMERFGDEDSMLPRIMQGAVAEKQKPDTLGEINILQQNAGKYLGSIIRNYDETLIEPDVQWFFNYNMKDPNINRGKGNYIAKALGFSSFENRVVRLHKTMQYLQLILSNEALMAESKLRPMLEEIAKMLEQNPETILKTPQEKQEEQKQMAEAQANAEMKAKKDYQEQLMLDFEMEKAKKGVEHEQGKENKLIDHKIGMVEKDEDFENKLVLERVK